MTETEKHNEGVVAYEKINNKLYRTYRGGKSHTQRKQERNAYEHVRREDVRRPSQKTMRLPERSKKSYAGKASEGCV